MTTNLKATLRTSLTFTDAHAQAAAPPALSVQAPYLGQEHGGIDVPAATADDTAYDVSFGSVAAATAALVENKTPYDLDVQINPPPFVTGTLVSGTKDLTLANAVGDRLEVAMVTSGGTPGVLSVKRKSDSEVTVQSWLSGTGIQASDTSAVIVRNYGEGYAFRLAPGGFIAAGAPVAAGSKPIAAVRVKTTETNTLAGTIATDVFGDPV